MANTTESASGVNRYFAVPVRNTTVTNTMQIESVETKVGTAICCAPSRIERMIGFPCPRLRWMFSNSTVASSTRMPTANAIPPSVITLIVCPQSASNAAEVRMESGMEMHTITVLRQLPRNNKIISAVRNAASTASCSTLPMASRTKTD